MITIKPATLSNLAGIQQLNHIVMADNIQFDPEIDVNFDLQEAGEKLFRESITNEDGIFLLAYDDDNKLLGYINGEPKETPNRSIKTFEINNLGVIPECRRKGVASALYQEITEQAKKLGFKRIYLNCYIKNSNALEFYKKLGFEPVDISMEKSIA